MADFTLPEISCPFPSQMSPYREQAREHSLHWAQDFHLLQKETALQHYRAVDLAGITCRIYYRANLQEILFITDWVTWLAVCDDWFDDSELSKQPEEMSQVQLHLLDVLHDFPLTPPEGPLAEALSDIWCRADSLASPAWKKRFAQHHADYFAGCRWEAEHRANQQVPDLRDYIENRLQSAATPLSYDLFDLTRHFQFPAEILEDPLFQDAVQAADHLVTWINDVYSFKKEQAHGDICNLIIVVRHAHHCSLQEAIDQVSAMIEREMLRFQEIISLFPSYSPDVDPLLHQYFSDLGTRIRGPLDWYQETRRYSEQSMVSTYLGEALPFSPEER